MAPETLLLALDTSTDRGALALARAAGGALEPLAEAEYEAEPGHAERLLPALDALFAGAGLRPATLGAIVVGLGPGSFSGLRAGVTTAKALGFATGARVTGVSGLAALAAASGASEGLVVALLDARRDEVFAAAYRAGAWLEPVEAPRLLSIAGARQWLASLPVAPTLVGTGAPLVAPGTPPGHARPPALALAALGALGAALLAGGGPHPPVEPLYVRPPNATLPAPPAARR